MKNQQDPKDLKKNADDEKITNNSEKVVNKQPENLHEATNEETWVEDVNEEFGEHNILPEDDDDEVKY